MNVFSDSYLLLVLLIAGIDAHPAGGEVEFSVALRASPIELLDYVLWGLEYVSLVKHVVTLRTYHPLRQAYIPEYLRRR
jgi:hypothetical protein